MSASSLALGFLQGITEFLPVSSSGHLFLLEHLLSKNTPSLSLVLLLHLATFCSICFVFAKDIKKLSLDFLKKDRKFFYKFCISLLPCLAVGLFLKEEVQQSFEKQWVALGFFVSGVLLASLFFIRQKEKTLDQLSFLSAFFIGSMQALAVFPGFSRSALTISTALYCGLSARSAVLYSFLISLPVIFGSTGIEFISSRFDGFEDSATLLFFSFLIAFLTGVFSLIVVLKLTLSRHLYFFCFYLIPLSFYVFFLA